MTSAELLVDAFGRIREVVHRVIDGLSPEQLAFRVDPEANSIAWLVWHLTRIQDDHLADAFEAEQVWLSQGWVGGSTSWWSVQWRRSWLHDSQMLCGRPVGAGNIGRCRRA